MARDLPPRVYLNKRTGAYYFVDASKKWHRIGGTREEAIAAHLALTAAPERRDIAAALDRFKREVLPTKATATQRTWAYSIKRLKPVFGHMLPGDLQPSHVWTYWQRRGAHRQARHEVQVLSSVMTWAMRWGLADSNPVIGLRFPRNPPRDRYVDDAELAAWQAVARPKLRHVVTVALATGLRQNDILTLRRDEVTPEGILRKPSKAGPKLLIRWSPELRDAVTSLLSDADYVVTNRSGKPYTTQGFQAIWQQDMRKLPKGSRFQFRDIRAKSATDEGDLERASKRLGHSTTRLTRDIYQRLPTEVPALSRTEVGSPPNLADFPEFM